MAEDINNNTQTTQAQINNNIISDNIDSKQALQNLLEETHPDWNFHWKRVGNQIRGYCPFHNDSHKPNLFIADKGEGAFYKCFACGASGSLRSLKKRQENPEYYKKIDEQKNTLQVTGILAKFFAENLTREEGDDIHKMTRDIIIEYLDERNDQIYNAVKNKIIIGFVPRNFDVEDQINQFYKNREIYINFDQLTDELKTKLKLLDKFGGFLVFFYTDIDGNITEFKLRNVMEEDEYRSNKQIYTINFIENNGNSGFLLSGIGNAIEEFTEIYIVEGEFDALSVYAYFNPDEEYSSEEEINTKDNTLHIVAAGGLDNMYNLAKTLAAEKYMPILIPDFDKAGQNSILRIIENAKRDKMINKIGAVIIDEDNRELINKAKDLDELFKAGSKRATFFLNVKPKLLTKIIKFIKTKEEELIIKEISQKPQNLQELFIESKNIDPDKIKITKVRKMDVLEVMNEPLPPLDFIMPGLKARTVGVFYASSGLGKSFLSLELAAAVAGAPNILSKYEDGSDVDLFSIKKHGKVTYLSLEDDMDVLKIRVKKIMHYIKMIYKDKFEDIKETLRKNFNVISLFGSGITIANPDKVVEYCKDSRIAIIDTLSRFNNYEENSNTEMAKFIVDLEKIIVKTDSSFLVIHHITKNKDDEGGYSRGAGAIDSNSRFKCTLAATPDDNIKLFAIKKANYGASEQKVYMKKLNDDDYIDEIQNNESLANSSFNFGGILVPVKTTDRTYDDDDEIYNDRPNTQKHHEKTIKEKKSKSSQNNNKNNNTVKIVKKQLDNNANGEDDDGDSVL